ncbi:hypothetical protein PflCFBP13517_25600 [Pseudomonas fluorescens]|nr:hypothetical protein PflCFBP13517_25600 [Pseudomonas fluorescens]
MQANRTAIVSGVGASNKLDLLGGASSAESKVSTSARQEEFQTQAVPTSPLMGKPPEMTVAKQVDVPTKSVRQPVSDPEAGATKSTQGYLQVPFKKGEVTGLITVSKDAIEYSDRLLLSASNTSVFTHLSDGLAQDPDARWRLADHQEHQHGSHEREGLDEEDDEGGRRRFPDKKQQDGQGA